MPKLHNFTTRQLDIVVAGLSALEDLIDSAPHNFPTRNEVKQLRLSPAVQPVHGKEPKRPRKPSKCPSCGSKDQLTYGPDPYHHDINGDDTPVWLCERCIAQHAADV